MQVDWGGVLSINQKEKVHVSTKSKLWSDICKPRNTREVFGNDDAKKVVDHWFNQKQLGEESKNCLFVFGPSGTGKSSFVELCAREHGFDAVITHADMQRTPQKMEIILREVAIRGGMLVLDDFEAFLKETSSMKMLLRLAKDVSSGLMLIVICNGVDKSFQLLRDVSDTAEFHPLHNNDMHRILNRLATRVAEFCYVPPMDCYLIAHGSTGSTGNASQTLHQMQLMYTGTKKPGTKRKKRLQAVDAVSRRDTVSKLTTFRNASIENFTHDDDLLNTLFGMNRDFLEDLGENLHMNYLEYFHNGSLGTLSAMSECIDNLSLADTGRPEFHEDCLYDTENVNSWVEDGKNYVIRLCGGIKKLSGFQRNHVHLKKKKQNNIRRLQVDYK